MLAVLCCFGVAIGLVVQTIKVRHQSRVDVLSRLAAPNTAAAKMSPLASNKELASRVLARLPRPLLASMERRAALAGERSLIPVLRTKLLALATVTPLLALTIARGLTVLGVIFLGLLTFAAWSAPDLAQVSRGNKRQDGIRLELADTADQLAVCMTAGLGFDAAVARIVTAGAGPLADELGRALHDVTLGATRAEALDAMLERTDVSELGHFVVAIRQAERYGVSLANTLRLQAAELRDKRTQWAEEQATKVPVKLLFPLVFCIMPALFIILLGPVVIKITSGGLGM